MDLNVFFLTYIPVIGGIITLYYTLKKSTSDQSEKLVKQENRLTLMEKDIEHLKEQIELNVKRLDNHDEQNRVLIALTEQVKALSEDIKRVEKKLEKGL